MKIKYSLILLMLIASVGSVFSKDTPTYPPEPGKTESEICAVVSALANWMEGQVLPGNTLMAYINTSHGEFLEFANNNGVNEITLDFYWKSKNGNQIQAVSTEIIEDVYGSFRVENWSAIIENADTLNGDYYVRIKINDDPCGEEIMLPIVVEEVEEEEEELPIELPAFVCGDPYTYQTPTNTNLLKKAEPGDVFIIGGFPILLETVSGEGYFDGEGLIPLPFGRKVVKVDFTGIAVNRDYEVLSGTVTARPDDPLNYPDFTIMPEPLNIGGDICLPPPPAPGYNGEGVNEVTGLDPWGFNPETGINSSTNTPYDPNGFDVNGNHKDTGGPYNEAGCDREGFDINGDPCDPSGGPNQQAEAFADSVSTTMTTTLTDIINGLITDLTDSLTALDCQEIRTEMETLLGTLGYPRNVIFGPGDEYFYTEMHKNFTAEPQELSINGLERNANVENLEKKHVELYHCDKAEYVVSMLSIALGNMSDPAEMDTLKEEILEKIRNWTPYEYSLYANDTDLFQEWLIRQIGDDMKENSNLGEEYGYWEQPLAPPSKEQQMQSIFDFSNRGQWSSTTAALNNNSMFDQGFTLEDASFFFRQGDQTINGVDRAYFLQELARQQAMLNGGGNNLLPVSVEKTIGNRTFTIYLDEISFSPTGASLNGYAIIDDPETGRQFVMKGMNISFGPTGTQGPSRLELVSDVEIRLNNAAMLILKGGTGDTYIEWDCSGFVSMGIDAQVEFCRNYITPLDSITLEPIADEEERYRLDFKVQNITSWLEFYVTANAKPFAVTQYDNVKWALTNMVIDFSSTATPEFTPMDGYASAFYSGGQMAPGWKGFYVELLTATFPDDFSKDPNKEITASAFDILIDGSGFTGGVSAEGLVDISEGNLSGWAFSIDEFQLRILQNQFAGAGLGGVVNIPIFEENMEYEAVMYPGNLYKFTVSPDSVVTSDLFLAKGELNGNSKIDVTYADGIFTAEATLSGKLHVKSANNPIAGIEIDFPELTFNKMILSNQAPYFKAGTWGVNGQGASVGFEFNGFGLRLSNIGPYESVSTNPNGNEEAGLTFNIDVNLVEALGVNAMGGFKVIGELTNDNGGRQKWKFTRVKIDKFSIATSFQGVSKVNGLLEWYEDTPGWGSGFRGILDAGFEKIGLEVQAAAQFGKMDAPGGEYKYFFIDALANLGKVGAGTGVLQLKGFGGGVSYHMDVTPGPAINFEIGGEDPELPALGESISGTTYRPDKGYKLGLRATAILGTVQEEIFNGTVSLSFLFNDNNGLSKINITGSGQFLKEIDLGITGEFVDGATSPPGSVNAALSAFIDIGFNFDEPSFHGTLNVFLNAPPFLRGKGSGGRMVDAELHFDPKKWYIFVGRPEEGKRCGVIFEIPGVGSIESDSYMNVGTETPPMAPLPAKVREIAYKVNTNETLRRSGAGFIFGASLTFKLSASIGNIVGASLEASAGFDMMLRKYDGLTCQGSTDPVGIDGWYATGQIWAYATGELRAFGVNVAKAGIAAVLQARLPNPFWAQATVGVKVKMLFVSVRKSLKLELGDDCRLVSPNTNDDLGMEVITFLEPYDGAVEVEPSARPKGYFALPLDKKIGVTGLGTTIDSFLVTLEYAVLKDQDGNEILTEEVFGEDKTYVQVVPSIMLPGKTDLTLEVKVRVDKNDAFLAYETKSVTFTTADDLCFIPESNVVASYPVDGMVNFYKNEYNKGQGYIQLETGQTNLLANYPSSVTQKVRIKSSDDSSFDVDYTYDIPAERVVFDLPADRLVGGGLYKVELYRREKPRPDKNQPVGTLASSQALSVALSGTGGSSVPVGSNGPSGGDNRVSLPEEPVEKILYAITFRVSEYDRFLDKLNAIAGASSGLDKPLNAIEGFGSLEFGNFGKYDALVGFDVNINNSWVNEFVLPEMSKIERYVCYYAIPKLIPRDALKKAGEISNPNGKSFFVSGADFEQGSFVMPTGQSIRIDLEGTATDMLKERQQNINGCSTQHYFSLAADCREAQNDPNSSECKALDAYIQLTTGGLREQLYPGTYKATVTYTLPGIDLKTTSKRLNFIKS